MTSTTSANTGGNAPSAIVPEATSAVRRTPPPAAESLVAGIMAGHQSPASPRKRKLSTTAELMAERQGQLPVWIRSPKSGPEHYVGFTRAKLYELAGDRKIRSVSIREPGQVKGVRLFHLGSILDFVARCEASANAKAEGSK